MFKVWNWHYFYVNRFARNAQAPEETPEKPPTRFARGAPPPPEAPEEVPQAPKRVARQAEDVDQPKAHLRQETLYTSVTTLSRKKRAAASNFITKIHA